MNSQIHEEALRGLQGQPKKLPPKLFYDRRGSELFDVITGLEEYYVTRVERRLLHDVRGEISERVGPGAVLIEYGAGNGEKASALLRSLRDPAAYVPIDVSEEHLHDSAAVVARRYPEVRVTPVVADFLGPHLLERVAELMPFLGDVRGSRFCALFLGSTIGNLDPPRARELLGAMLALVGKGGCALVGVDLIKDPAVLELAYNDPGGVTAKFNLNVLVRLNRECGADFDLSGFRHEAFFDAELGRVEMHLRSLRRQSVRLAGARVDFDKGETIHTESSYKYTVEAFQKLAVEAGFAASETRAWTDANGLYSVHFLEGSARYPSIRS